MTRVAKTLEQDVLGNSPLRRVILRSAHPNALKRDVSVCPPRDMRNPHTANVATTIMRDIAKTFSSSSPAFSFLNTEFLMNPFWDSAYDYNHYEHGNEAGMAESKFILSEILKEEKQKLLLEPVV